MQRTYRYGAVGCVVVGLAALVGYGLFAWTLRDMFPPSWLIGGAVAGVAVPAAGMALGRAFMTGFPYDRRLFTLAAGGALGAVCLLAGSFISFMFLLFENL